MRPRVPVRAVLAAWVLGSLPGVGLAQAVEQYGYDSLGRLIAVDRSSQTNTAYRYDAAGNRTTVTTLNQMEAVWQAESLPHVIGYGIPGGWEASAGLGSGFMTYGPYTPATPTGLNIASWRIKVDSHTYPDTGDVVALDIWDATAGVSLGSAGFDRRAFTASDTYQYLDVPFALVAASSGHQLEFRTWSTGRATVGVDALGYRRAGSAWSGTDSSIYHVVGRAAADGWAASVTDPAGHMTYGPYAAAPVGARTAIWRMRINDNTSPDTSPIVTIDIWDASAGQSLGTRTLKRQDWKQASQFQLFEIPFVLDPARAGHALEYRTYFHRNANVVLNWVGYR